MDVEHIIRIIEQYGQLDQIDEKSVLLILDKIKHIFANEQQVIDIPNHKNTVFVGDTHGDYSASIKAVKNYLDNEHHLVFLGDYVDRAQIPYGDIRNILYLFCKKIQNKNLILLRGNHEDAKVNIAYGFRENVLEIWPNLINKFNDVFTYMPLCAVSGKVIALHGGLPKINNLKEINSIPKGHNYYHNDIQDQILWNDCANSRSRILEKNNRGIDTSIIYGRKYFNEIMEKIYKNILIRAHDSQNKGTMYDDRCITLFTAERFVNMGIKGRHIVKKDNKGIRLIDLDSNEILKKIE